MTGGTAPLDDPMRVAEGDLLGHVRSALRARVAAAEGNHSNGDGEERGRGHERRGERWLPWAIREAAVENVPHRGAADDDCGEWKLSAVRIERRKVRAQHHCHHWARQIVVVGRGRL